MIINLNWNNKNWQVNLSQPIDISLAVKKDGVKAWYVENPRFTPGEGEGFIGSVALGGSVNFFEVAFHPHGHGTHTECYGHISKSKHSVNTTIQQFHCIAWLVSINPVSRGNDAVITLEQIKQYDFLGVEALIVRSLPNLEKKQSKDYSSTNPPYFEPEALEHLRISGIKHLLVDMPSVDREEDEGKLLAHRAFWQFNVALDKGNTNTITELIYVPNAVKDGYYFMNLQVSAFENDAAPSRPVIFQLF